MTKPPSLRERLIQSGFEKVPEEFKPTREALDHYLDVNRRAPGSLIAAFILGGDTNLLLEAATRFPDDPQVQLAVVTRNLFPEQRREWLEAFKQSSPNNALPDYLAALDQLKSGDAGAALENLHRATGKTGVDDFFRQTMQNMEEAHLSAGLPVVDAKLLAMMELPLPHLQPLRDLGREIMKVHQSYQQAGDAASASQVAAYAIELGRDLQTRQPVPIITELVGIAIEMGALKQMDAGAGQSILGVTIEERLAQLDASKEGIRDLAKVMNPFDPAHQMTDVEIMAYLDRSKMFGELDAMRWMKARTAAP